MTRRNPRGKINKQDEMDEKDAAKKLVSRIDRMNRYLR